MLSSRPLAVALALMLGGCAPTVDAELLEVEAVGPERLDRGAVLRVEAEGLPVGREGTLRLRGRFHAPGEAPRDYDETLEVRAVAADRAEVPVEDALLRRLGGRGTFVGDAELAFASPRGQRVVGRQEARLDLGSPRAVGIDRDQERAAAAHGEALGLRLEEAEPGTLGLGVAEVVDGGPAARAGVRPGDRIVAVHGGRARSPAELLPQPGAAPQLTLLRDDVGGERRVRIPLEAPRAPSPFPFGAAALLLFAALVGPLARLRFERSRRVGPLVRLGLFALGGAALVRTVGGDLMLWGLALAILALGRGFACRRPLGALLEVAPLGLAFGAAALQLGTTSLAAALAAQGEGWGDALLLRSPISALAFFGGLGALGAGGLGPRVLRDVERGLAAGLLALLFVGGALAAAPLPVWFALAVALGLAGGALPAAARRFAGPTALAGLVWAMVGATSGGAPVDPAELTPPDARAAFWIAGCFALALAVVRSRRAPAEAHLHL